MVSAYVVCCNLLHKQQINFILHAYIFENVKTAAFGAVISGSTLFVTEASKIE